MGAFDWLTGSKAPADTVIQSSAGDARKALLGINRDTAPFVVRDGTPEGFDLVAEWKIVDARWYEIFAVAGIKRVFKVLMRFDQTRGEICALDEEWQVGWRAGVPELIRAGKALRGRKWEFSAQTVYTFREDLSFGEIYSYKFLTGEIKAPL